MQDNLPIVRAKIDSGKVLHAEESEQGLVNAGYRMSIFYCDLIQGSVIHANSYTAVWFLCKDQGCAPGGIRFRNNAILEILFDEFFDLLKVEWGMGSGPNIDRFCITGINMEGFQFCRADLA